MAAAAGQDGKVNVFISYSRDDLAFADQLDAALGLAGFRPPSTGTAFRAAKIGRSDSVRSSATPTPLSSCCPLRRPGPRSAPGR
jgi:hypothetical protein